MSFKDILLALTTYPDPTPISAIEEAVEISAAIDARISAIACQVRFRAPSSILGNAILDIPKMVATEARKSADNADNLLAAFESYATKRGVMHDQIYHKCLLSEVPDVFADYARLRDLTIVPVPEGENFDQWSAETIIFGSGRPTIILPHTRQRSGPTKFETIVVAWDFSRPAARTVGDALPILKKAKKTFVVIVMDEKVIETTQSGAELARHLARHGVEVILDQVDSVGRHIGEVLEAHVALRNADLLVMGAYGHSRVREFVLGGATRSMLARPPTTLFLSH